jgi:hypothetical protein
MPKRRPGSRRASWCPHGGFAPRGVRVTPVEGFTRNDLNQVLAEIADGEPDLRLPA